MLLSVIDLKTSFRLVDGAEARAVDGITFSVDEGESLAIVGESGCGKSQTAFSIMRLLPANGYHSKESRILLNGSDLLALPEASLENIRGNQMAMIFQEPMSSLNPLYRIGNQLAEPLMAHQGLGRKEARKRAVALLGQVGIPDPESRIDNHPHEMSGGMKQRVMIAMALACRPRLLIADEPTTALDVTIQAQILGLIQDLQAETGMGLIFITHDLGIVNQVADRVVVMYGGRVVEEGSRAALFERPEHPYTRRLLASIPAASDHSCTLHTISGQVPGACEVSPGCRFFDRCLERIPVCKTPPPGVIVAEEEGEKVHQAFCHLLNDPHLLRVPSSALLNKRPPRAAGGAVIMSVNDLTTHFPVRRGLLMRTVNQVKAVDGFSLSIREGETVALVGESGCGKTTVGQSILRLVSEARGRISLDGIDVMAQGSRSLKELRRHMQIVFQDPFSSLSPRLKVGAIVGEGLTVHERHLSLEECKSRILAVLGEVGLPPEVVDRYPHEFSGGQRQRIALARALILEPRFLVLDEPTSALDVSVQSQVLNLLEEIQLRRRLAYLFITHDLGVVEYLADRVAVMYLGRVVELSPVRRLFALPGHPYTRTLLQSVPRIGERRSFGRIQGDVPSPLNPPTGCHFHPRCPFAVDRCRQEYPALRPVDEAEIACHRAQEIPAYSQAWRHQESVISAV